MKHEKMTGTLVGPLNTQPSYYSFMIKRVSTHNLNNRNISILCGKFVKVIMCYGMTFDYEIKNMDMI